MPLGAGFTPLAKPDIDYLALPLSISSCKAAVHLRECYFVRYCLDGTWRPGQLQKPAVSVLLISPTIRQTVD